MKVKKYISILLFIIVCQVSVFAADRVFDIKIQVKGIKNDTALLAYYYEANKFIQDSIYFNDKGIAYIKGKKDYANGVYLLAFPKLGYKSFDLIIKESQFSMTTDTLNFIANMKIVNSAENKALYDDVSATVLIGQKMDSLRKIYNTLKETDLNYLPVKNQIDKHADEIRTHRQKIITKYPNTLYTSLLSMMLSPIVPEQQKNGKEWKDTTTTVSYIKENYFNIIDFKDSSYVRSPILKTFVHQYFDQFIYPAPDSLIIYVDKLIDKASNGSHLMYRYVLNLLYEKYSKSQVMGYDKIFVHLAEKYYLSGKAPWSEEENLKKIKSYVEDIKPTLLGSPAPNFSFKDSNLVDLNFHTLLDKNRYTVLVFWNSDCGHCQKEIPLLKSVYDTLKNLDVLVVSISTEQTDTTFKKFVKANCHQDWVTGWDPNGTSAFRREYNVVTTPRIFIIDRKEKKLRAKNLPTNDIYGYIQFLIRNEEK
jgi:thiol-disulfide isomerase/thioredoxin